MDQHSNERKSRTARAEKDRSNARWNTVTVIACIVLLCEILCLCGTASEFFLKHGNHRLAAICMVSDGWMEKHKHDERMLIQAWDLYDKGELEDSMTALRHVNPGELPLRLSDPYVQLCLSCAHALSPDDTRIDDLIARASYFGK